MNRLDLGSIVLACFFFKLAAAAAYSEVLIQKDFFYPKSEGSLVLERGFDVIANDGRPPSFTLASVRYVLSLLAYEGCDACRHGLSLGEEDLIEFLSALQDDDLSPMDKSLEEIFPLSRIHREMLQLSHQMTASMPSKKQLRSLDLLSSYHDDLVKSEILSNSRSRAEGASRHLYKLFVRGDGESNSLDPLAIRSWLVVMAPYLSTWDPNLVLLKRRIGNYQISPEWRSELHLHSLSKHNPRRIYRNPSLRIVIAETLDLLGLTIETEVVEKIGPQVLAFATFNENGDRMMFANFKSHRDTRYLKTSPDSCMACHFEKSTRQFNLVRPSAKNLGLGNSKMPNQAEIEKRRNLVRPGEKIHFH